MKECNEYQMMVLQAGAGELDAGDAAALDAHVAACAECRAFRADADRLVTIGRNMRTAAPREATITAILDHARNHHRRTVLLPFPRLAPWVLAYAAVFVAMLAGWLMFAPATRHDTGADMHALLAIVLEDTSDAGSAESTGTFAEQLLELEGLAVEEITEPEPEATEPTALQPRNSGAFQAGTRV